MGLTREHIQEDLSTAYISAVAAKAGFDCNIPMRHDYGVDLEITQIEFDGAGGRVPSGRSLRIQAKATHTVNLSENGDITYSIKKGNYNKLVKETGVAPPCILVLYCMPKDDNEWLSICDHEQAVLKHCGYWISLRGLEKTKNKDKISIKIPKDNIFNETSLTNIMNTIQNIEARL